MITAYLANKTFASNANVFQGIAGRHISKHIKNTRTSHWRLVKRQFAKRILTGARYNVSAFSMSVSSLAPNAAFSSSNLEILPCTHPTCPVPSPITRSGSYPRNQSHQVHAPAHPQTLCLGLRCDRSRIYLQQATCLGCSEEWALASLPGPSTGDCLSTCALNNHWRSAHWLGRAASKPPVGAILQRICLLFPMQYTRILPGCGS